MCSTTRAMNSSTTSQTSREAGTSSDELCGERDFLQVVRTNVMVCALPTFHSWALGRGSTVIACLGWGSIVWKPGDLPVGGAWRSDGPLLPVEFARQSQDGRITLVVVDSARPCTVLWVPLNVEAADEARSHLGCREQIPSSYWQDYTAVWPSSSSANHSCTRQVVDWALSKGIDQVVWTALPPKFGGQNGRLPSSDETVDYLSGLEGDTLRRAKEYVQRVPVQIRTRYRERIESELGWVCAADY
jgi:hypothetical protein